MHSALFTNYLTFSLTTGKELILYQPPLSEILLKNGQLESEEILPEEPQCTSPGSSSEMLTKDMRLRIREMEDWGEEDMEDIGVETYQLVTYPESDRSEISPTELSNGSYNNVKITEIDDESMEVD